MITIFVIAVGLSMDAFSLSLIYGTLNLTKQDIIKQSLIVGIYHFIMPNIGNVFRNIVTSIIPINTNIIVFLVFFIIGIQMILESFKKNDVKIMNIKEMIMFGFAVSIDSFSIGLGLKSIYHNVLISSLIFMIVSLLFTYIGLVIGKKVNNIVGEISTIIGGIILLIVGLLYII